MRRVVAMPALLGAAGLAFAGCGRAEGERAALDLAVRAMDNGRGAVDLEFRREIDGGFVWRLSPRPLGSGGEIPTHLGVIACADGDRATEAVRFSFLHWEPERCAGGRAKLRRVRLTHEQDAERLGTFVSPPIGIEDDPALHRVS